jgi:hypothetical protein
MKKVTKQKRPQPWSWAQAHEERVRKHWNWKLLDAKWDKNRKAQYTCGACRSALYKWKAFGFDGKLKNPFGLSLATWTWLRTTKTRPTTLVWVGLVAMGDHDELA